MVKINDRRNVAMGRGRNHRPASNVKELVRHHTGVNVDQSMAILEGYWKNTHGWDIGGYHEVIHPDGTVDLNYDPTTMTYGVGNHNPYTMHISLIGNGKFTDAQEKAFEERALYHMKNLNISVEKVKGHNEYSGHEKNACPGIDMSGVRTRLKALLNKPVSNPSAPDQSGIVKKYAETGVFYPNDTIIVRDQPSTKGAIIARYYKGEKVTYHTVHLGNGYVWLQYNRSNDKQGYIPCREYVNGKYGMLWGTIK